MPDACLLPSVERPVRVAEFDGLFARSLRGQARPAPTLLRWRLDLAAEAAVRELARRESSCCSFFAFAFTRDETGLDVEVQVPPAHAGVLDALEARAAAATIR